MHLCGVMTRSMYTYTRKKYKIAILHQSMVMYGLKWKVVTSWSRFSTRAHTDTHPHRETHISMICHRGVILAKTISYIITSLVVCHVMTHQPLYFIVFYGSTVITWHIGIDKRKTRNIETHRAGIYFWKTIPLAHLFLCSAAPIQNYFSQFAFYTCRTCSDTIGT